MKTDIKWNNPEVAPDVELGTEKRFWIAVLGRAGGVFVYDALYQNRPVIIDDNDIQADWVVHDRDGEPHHSVGWVDSIEAEDFDYFHSEIQFTENYKLMGWAEYVKPEFTGVYVTSK